MINTNTHGRIHQGHSLTGVGITTTRAVRAYRKQWRDKSVAEPKQPERRTSVVVDHYAKHLEQIQTTYKPGRTIDRVYNASRIYVIGDVQGDAKELTRELMEAGVIMPNLGVADDAPYEDRYSLNADLSRGAQIVFLGDYVDRGNEGIEVLHFVANLQDQAEETDGRVRVHTIRGNHEAMLLRLIELLRKTPLEKVREIFANSKDFEYLISVVLDLSHIDSNWKEFKFLGSDPKAINDMGIATLFDTCTLDSILRCYSAEYDRLTKIKSSVKEAATLTFGSGGYSSADVTALEPDLWQFACRRMEEDGTLDFVRSTKAAVRIDDALFMHGGPVLSIRSLDDLDNYFVGLLGDSRAKSALFCPWADINVGDSTRSDLLATKFQDFSMVYHDVPMVDSRKPSVRAVKWSENPYLFEWLNKMGAFSYYVGHRKSSAIKDVNRGRIICADGGLATVYGSSVGGLLVINPLSSDAARIRYVVGERGATDARDFSCNLRRIDVLRNAYSLAAAISLNEVTAPEPISSLSLPPSVLVSITFDDQGIPRAFESSISSDQSFNDFLTRSFYPNGRFDAAFCVVAYAIASDLFKCTADNDPIPEVYAPYAALIQNAQGDTLHQGIFRATVALTYLSGLAPSGTSDTPLEIFGSIPAPSELESKLASGTDLKTFRTLYHLSSYYTGELLLLAPEFLLPVCDVRAEYDSTNPSGISDLILRMRGPIGDIYGSLSK